MITTNPNSSKIRNLVPRQLANTHNSSAGEEDQVQLGSCGPGSRIDASSLRRACLASNTDHHFVNCSESQAQVATDVACSMVGGPSSCSNALAVAEKHSPQEKEALFNFVKENAGEDQLFPDPNDGYYGLNVFLLEGEEAKNAAGFAEVFAGRPVDYDPGKHSFLVTANSFDEPSLGFFLVNRGTQSVEFSDEGDTTMLDEQSVAKHFPEVSIDEAMFQVVGELASRGEFIGKVEGEDGSDSMDFADWKA